MPTLDQLVDRVSAALWNLHPSTAVRLGRHEYDGVVPDVSAGTIGDGYERLGRLRGQVVALAGLTAGQELDRETLLAALDAELLFGETCGAWRRWPWVYLELLDVGPYLGRDYAPAGLRVERAAAVLAAAPEVLVAARSNLDPVLSRPAAGWACRRARALAGSLAAGPSLVGWAGSEEERWLRSAAGDAAGEVEAFAAWLEQERLPAADESFALGPETLAQMLAAGERLGRSLGEIAGMAVGGLAADREAAETAGEQPEPGEEPSPGGWAAAVRAAAEEAGRFARGAGFAAGPEELPPTVVAGPAPGGDRVALDAPGPYDDPKAGAVLYAGRPGGRAGEVDDLAVAAAFPGRLLLSRRVAVAPTEASRRFGSPVVREGWALYAGEAMWEAGYRGSSPGWRRAWLLRAQRAGCRLVCAIALHAGEMSLEQAEGHFMEQAHCGQSAARLEAERAAADPGGLCAGLGRLEILDLRRRWEARSPGTPHAAFHDALLSRGAAPVGLLERVVLP